MAQIATFYDHIKDISRQRGISLMDAMGLARQLGVEALEVNQNNMIGREDEVGQELAFHDMSISAVPSYFDFGRDPDVARQALPTLEAASYLGAKKLLVIPGFLDQNDPPQERERQTQAMVDGVCRLAELAGQYGLSLVMEEYDNPAAPFSTTQGVLRFLQGCPALSACFDTGNFLPAGEEVLEAWEALKSRVGHVHLKDRGLAGEGDARRMVPSPVGAGALPLAKAVELIRAQGYDGAYTLEFYNSPDTLSFLEQSVAWLKSQL